MKYLKLIDGSIVEYLESSYAYAALSNLPDGDRPEFLDETDPLVIAYFAKQPTEQDLAIARVDADVDRIYSDAIGNRAVEYQTAESEALAFKSAGYQGQTPPCVASWMAAGGLTATQAADSILGQAAAWRQAVTVMRAQRLAAKAAIKANAPGALQQWAGFVAQIRVSLGLRP